MQQITPRFSQILRYFQLQLIVSRVYKRSFVHNIPVILPACLASLLLEPLVHNILQYQTEQVGPEAQILEDIILLIVEQFPAPLQDVHLLVVCLKIGVVVVHIVDYFVVGSADHFGAEDGTAEGAHQVVRDAVEFLQGIEFVFQVIFFSDLVVFLGH